MKTQFAQPHAIIFPFMAQGRTFPLLDLAKLMSLRGVKVTIITTPSNANKISSYFAPSFSSTISTHVIPFPVVDGLPLGCENTKDLTSNDQRVPFFRAILKLKQPFENYLKHLLEKGDRPICSICDSLLGWAITVSASFNIPGIYFNGMGVLSSTIGLTLTSNDEYMTSLRNGEKLETLPEFACPFPLIIEDLPSFKDKNSPLMKFSQENGDGGASSTCWGVLCNSFEEIEGEFVSALEDSFRRSSVKVWCVGPLSLYNDDDDNAEENPSSNLYKSWLDEQHERKEVVIYVSFGSQSQISKTQMNEIALGLDSANHPFMWVVRSSDWIPPSGWEERVKGRGLVIREWVDQRSLLAHPAIGGFLSHCGWNSILESLSVGVPILAWPMGAEQPLNAKFVVQVLKAGLAIDPKLDQVQEEGVRYGCNSISSGVKELMGQESGRLARKRAQEIGLMARNAVKEDGSSSNNLDHFINSLLE